MVNETDVTTKTRRCKAVRRSTGERCPNDALDGKRLCQAHNGSLKAPQVRRKAEVDRSRTDLERFVQPIGPEDDLWNPATGLHHEYAATQGRIRWLRDALSRLETAEDLIWGLTKEERIAASETPGTNRTYEARINVLLDLERAERKHLLDVEKLLANTAFKEAELALRARVLDSTYTAVVRTLEALGLSMDDPNVRDVLARELTA